MLPTTRLGAYELCAELASSSEALNSVAGLSNASVIQTNSRQHVLLRLWLGSVFQYSNYHSKGIDESQQLPKSCGEDILEEFASIMLTVHQIQRI